MTIHSNMPIKSFPVNDTLRVSAVKPFVANPHLFLHEGLLGAATNQAIYIPLDKVKELIAQLVEATVYLCSLEDTSSH